MNLACSHEDARARRWKQKLKELQEKDNQSGTHARQAFTQIDKLESSIDQIETRSAFILAESRVRARLSFLHFCFHVSSFSFKRKKYCFSLRSRMDTGECETGIPPSQAPKIFPNPAIIVRGGKKSIGYAVWVRKCSD